MPRASPPDNSGPFVSRRDRPEHQQRRAGTGRQISSREFGVLGRHTGARLQQTTKDFQGFDDLDQAWRSDDDDSRDNDVALAHRSSLFPESPMSASTVLNDPEPEPEIAGKRLEFSAGQNEDDEDEVFPNEVDDVPSDPVSESDHETEPLQTKTGTTDNSNSKGRAVKASEKVKKKPARKQKANKSSVESVAKPSKNGTAKASKMTKRKPSSSSSSRSPSSSAGSPVNDENQEPAHTNDSGSFTEDETVPIPSPAAKSEPAKRPKQNKTSSKSAPSKKKKRRQTLVIIDEAQQSGLIDQETMIVENDKLVRRSQRARCRPVNFFECEQPNYIRGPGGLFSLDREKAVIKHVPSPPPRPSHRSRHKRRRPKSWDESSDEEEELVPLSGETKVIGPNGKERRQIVAVRASDHSVTKIATKPPAGEKPQDKDLTGTICKFDGLDGVSAGIIQIPASGTKYPETAVRAELCFIASCERNSLSVMINNHEFKLSRGDTFMVPAKNSYSIQNTSRRKAAKIFFSVMRA